MKTPTEAVALARMDLNTAPAGHVTLRPFVRGPSGEIPALPWYLVLTNRQARELAQDLLDCAAQSEEDASEERH